MKSRKKKREFSKIIITIVGAVTLVVSAFTMAVVWKTSDTAPLAYLIPSVFGELATATGFYFSKAKAENRSNFEKYMVLKSTMTRRRYKRVKRIT